MIDDNRVQWMEELAKLNYPWLRYKVNLFNFICCFNFNCIQAFSGQPGLVSWDTIFV